MKRAFYYFKRILFRQNNRSLLSSQCTFEKCLDTDEFYELLEKDSELGVGCNDEIRLEFLQALKASLSKYGIVANSDENIADFYLDFDDLEASFIGVVSEIADPSIILASLETLKKCGDENYVISIDADEVQIAVFKTGKIVYLVSDDTSCKYLNRFGIMSPPPT